VAFIAVAVGWAVTRHPEEPKAAASEATPPVKIDASPVTLPPKPDETKPDGKKPVKASNKDSQKPAQEANPGAAKPPEPRFTFYKILPEKEAIIPESEITTLKHQESLSKRPPAAQYMLQAGSFTSPLDAVKLKEKLTAIKIKSHIENVKIENAAWNRVKIGPFKTLADTDKVRTYLRTNQIDSVVQKSVTMAPQAPAKH
jgi:cell division protein FtsN